MNVVIIFIFAFLVVGGSAKINLRDGSGILDVWPPLVTTVSFETGQMLNAPCLQTNCPLSKVNPSLCPALCSSNTANFQALLNDVISCYQKPLCGQNLLRQTINNVYQPFEVSGYNGTCVLTGPNVAITTPANPPITFTVVDANQSDTEVGYAVNVIVRYNWQGLVINCTSNDVSNSNRAANLLQQIGCFVFGKINVIASLLNLNCNSNVASNSFSGNIQFQDTANLTLFYTIYKNLTVSTDLVNNNITAIISDLGGAVPANWVPTITSGLQTLFNTFGFTFTYSNSIWNTAKQLFANIIVPGCNQTTSSTCNS